MSIKFFYSNEWDDEDHTLTESTEHENFPAENTQHRDHNKAWRSQHGSGTGWGRFAIWTGVNDEIDFQEGGGALNATLTQGIYDVDTLCTEIKTQMEAAGGYTYTPEYIESGTYANMFKITASAAPFSLLCDTGANQATAVWSVIGFSTALDRVGQQFYYANWIRIHTDEWIKIDLGAATTVYAVIVRGHNFTSAASVKFQFSTDDFATISENLGPASVFEGGYWVDPIILTWSSPKNYRYVRVYVEDTDNTDLYVKMGRVFVGGHFQPTRAFLEEMTHAPLDPSFLSQSENGQLSSMQLNHYFTKNYGFVMESADKTKFETMFASRGTSKDLFITEDTSSETTTTSYVKFNAWQFMSYLYSSSVWRLDMEVEELR